MTTNLITVPASSGEDAPLRKVDDLVSIFHASTKPRALWRIGAEMEKFGIRRDGSPVRYDDPHGILGIFGRLASERGWRPESEYPGGPVLSLLRGEESITLEPGGQLELSGAPYADVHQVKAGFDAHMRELAPISHEYGLTWLGMGFHPFARREEIPDVPKLRYPIMAGYLATRGALGVDMMKRTATVQANYDYSDEADAMRKLRIALKLGPVTTALFANSPVYEGRLFGGRTFRGKVWLDVDPDRSGLVPSVWHEGSGFEDYVAWAVDVPMFMIKRDGKSIANTGQTFRSFMKSGYEGHYATMRDWRMHLNTLFPEVRIKNTLEVRGADAQRDDLASALPALWTGIFYDPRALDRAEALVADWTHGEVAELRGAVWREGVRAVFRGRSVAEIGSELVAIAEDGLRTRAMLDASGKDEGVHLASLRALLDQGLCPADELLQSDIPLTTAVVRHARLHREE